MVVDQLFRTVAVIGRESRQLCELLPTGKWRRLPVYGAMIDTRASGVQGLLIRYGNHTTGLIDRNGNEYPIATWDGRPVEEGSFEAVSIWNDAVTYRTRRVRCGRSETVSHLALRKGAHIQTVRSRHDRHWWFAGGRQYEAYHWSHRVRVLNRPWGSMIQEIVLPDKVLTVGDRFVVDRGGAIYRSKDLSPCGMRIPLEAIWRHRKSSPEPLVSQAGHFLIHVQLVLDGVPNWLLQYCWSLDAWDLRNWSYLGRLEFEHAGSPSSLCVVHRAQLQRFLYSLSTQEHS